MRICILQDSSFSHTDVLELIKESFQQWLENGLESILLQFTPSEFEEKTAEGVVLVAIDEADNTLCGTTTFIISKNKSGERFAYNKFSAVKGNTRQKGIGSELLEYEKRMALKEGCCYILSNTSVLAAWSVKWHKKNGFKRIGFYSTITSDDYSYLFRCQLKSPSIWNCNLFTNVVFSLSYLKTRAMRRPDGSITYIGNIVLKAFRLLKLV